MLKLKKYELENTVEIVICSLSHIDHHISPIFRLLEFMIDDGEYKYRLAKYHGTNYRIYDDFYSFNNSGLNKNEYLDTYNNFSIELIYKDYNRNNKIYHNFNFRVYYRNIFDKKSLIHTNMVIEYRYNITNNDIISIIENVLSGNNIKKYHKFAYFIYNIQKFFNNCVDFDNNIFNLDDIYDKCSISTEDCPFEHLINDNTEILPKDDIGKKFNTIHVTCIMSSRIFNPVTAYEFDIAFEIE